MRMALSRKVASAALLVLALSNSDMASVNPFQPLGPLSLDQAQLGQGECYTITVQDASKWTLDMQYTYQPAAGSAGQVQTLYGWPTLDANGRTKVCTGGTTPLGTYLFTAIRNSAGGNWIPVAASVEVTAPTQPTFLTISPSVITRGSCYDFAAQDGKSMTLNVQYQVDGGTVQTLIGWPQLEAGRAYACAGSATPLGKYTFLAIRNSARTDWVGVSAAVTVESASPLVSGQALQEPLPELMSRVMAAYGATAAQVRDSIADGRFTFYALTDAGKWAPSLSGNITIYKQDTRKVQAMFKPDASNFLPFKWGTDGNRTWSSDAMGYQIPAGGPALWWTEVHTVRSVQRLLNYVQQQLVLHDMGINGTSHVVEAQDPEGRTTTYYIDIATARVIRLDFISGEARQMFSGAWLPTYETYIFSDFHTVDGVLTPFRITRNPDWDIQEVQLNNTIYNPGVPNSIFQPY